ncbi:MAG: hypothetical protein WAO15_21565, partial [Mycobacterium sp.]
IWALPDGHTCVTTPGSALLFPSPCAPTGDPPVRETAGAERCGDRTAMMPLRNRTRAQNRAHQIAAERRHNRQLRFAAQALQTGTPAAGPEEPPPF